MDRHRGELLPPALVVAGGLQAAGLEVLVMYSAFAAPPPSPSGAPSSRRSRGMQVLAEVFGVDRGLAVVDRLRVGPVPAARTPMARRSRKTRGIERRLPEPAEGRLKPASESLLIAGACLRNGKVGVDPGVANKRSIAWAIAKRAVEEGAQIVLTYQNERPRRTWSSSRTSRPQAAPPAMRRLRRKADRRPVRRHPGKARRHRLPRPRARVRPPRGARRLLHQHRARRLPDRARGLGVFARRPGPPRRAAHGRPQGQLRDADLPRQRARRRQLQRDGRREGRARVFRPLPRVRRGPDGSPRERDLGGADQDARRVGRGLRRSSTSAEEKRRQENVDAIEVADAAMFFSRTLCAASPARCCSWNSGFHAIGF